MGLLLLLLLLLLRLLLQHACGNKSLVASHQHSEMISTGCQSRRGLSIQTVHHHLQVIASDCTQVGLPSRIVHPNHSQCQLLPELSCARWSTLYKFWKQEIPPSDLATLLRVLPDCGTVYHSHSEISHWHLRNQFIRRFKKWKLICLD